MSLCFCLSLSLSLSLSHTNVLSLPLSLSYAKHQRPDPPGLPPLLPDRLLTSNPQPPD